MSDPFTSLIVLLKPYSSVLTAGLFIIILSELVLFRSDIIRSKVIKQKVQFSRKYDNKFLKLYQNLKISSAQAGLPKKNSNTIREMVNFLIFQSPTDNDILKSIQLSMEKCAYADIGISINEYSTFNKVLSSNKISSLSRARI
tara:strand:- start:358 stop:786 length:429 start_codon:yes stop_codon:yes gene_type:complete